MKKILLPFLFLMVFLNSCNKDAIYGNGQIKTENRNLTLFSKINVVGDFDVKIVNAPQYSVQIRSHSNIIPFIQSEVEDSTIQVFYETGTQVINARSEIIIALPKLNALDLVGNARAVTSGKFTGNKMVLSGTGNGRIELEDGEYHNLECRNIGDFVIKAFNTRMLSANIEMHGNGHVQVSVRDKLTAEIHGNGKIYYKGNPEIRSDIHGNGKIIKS